jgi:hypothetical protein
VQAEWMNVAKAVLRVLVTPPQEPVKDTALLNEAAADLRTRLKVLRGGKL